ncbi:MAG TPA: monovalent cation:proton antiporter-2 (CPA2) family protein [Stellaceae bacterium]|jgi:CPA2 family monovalent cation:H+ antiporter-2/glutathione-regulated potassium-efflux system protein KefB|nr:monovalent cation:proton antiporter-2 (CPA2) family protein [Stellaceae bacterium]
MLEVLVPLLAAAVLFVSLSRRSGFGSVLGYLVAGAVIGPFGLRLVSDVKQITAVSELGVVMLLFLIGLEVRPQRLWVMRKAVFGLGLGQLVATGFVLAVLVHAAGVAWTGATVLGAGLAMSSTAIVLPLLGERNLLGTRGGRDTFAVLLFQDLAFIPLVALVPLLSNSQAVTEVPWRSVAAAFIGVAAILLGGRFLVPQVFRIIGGARTPEVFTATALLVVAGTAYLANTAGLSMSLGAFLAGVLLSSSEYRHELQADIEPFEGLLLGFFFMSVGMSAALNLVVSEPLHIALGVLLLLGAKVAIAFVLAKLGGRGHQDALRFALALPQGSEFSFVLFGAAVAVGVLDRHIADLATLVIALSMVATPVLFAISERFLAPRLAKRKERPYDEIKDAEAPVIICGFGRVGQVVGRILNMRGIGFTALEKDVNQVESVRAFGYKIYYGNPSRPDLLRAAGAKTAKVLVLALDDMEETLVVAGIARRNFPHLQIFVRARNRRHWHLLVDSGVDGLVRDTFYSSLRLSEMVLIGMGIPEAEAVKAVELFRRHDERALEDAHAFYQDEQRLIQNAQELTAELATLFEGDKPDEEGAAAQ